ncbi:MAG: hypothetical protein ACXADF_17150 [Candidatus Thorarchaeota archaeon]|jgi:hypothetical protein
MKVFGNLLLGFVAVLILVTAARSDFREDICFPVGAGACVSLQDTIINDELMVRGTSPDVLFHDTDATDEDDNVRFRVNCDTVTSGAENCNLVIAVQEAGVLTDRLTIDAGGSTTISAIDGEQISDDTIDDNSIDWSDVTCVDMTATDCGAVTSTGTITAAVGFDCTGAADCDLGSADITDFTMVTDGGTVTIDGDITSPGTVIVGVGLDATGAVDMDYGSADITDHTFISDSTGDAEFVTPVGGIGPADVLDTMCSQVLTSAVDPTEASATVDYLSMKDGTGSTTENNEDDFQVAAAAMVVSNLYCVTATAPGAGNDPWAMTVRTGVAGSLGDSAVTCTIDEAATTCSDATNSAAVAAGERITISIDSAGGDADPTASALIECSMCLSN